MQRALLWEKTSTKSASTGGCNALPLQDEFAAALQLQMQARPPAPSHMHRSYTPLTKAAQHGHPGSHEVCEMCELLLQLKADINKP